MSVLSDRIEQNDYIFIKVEESPSAYIYQYCDNATHEDVFETFKKKRDNKYNEIYPSEDDFEVWAFSFNTIEEAMRKFNQL